MRCFWRNSVCIILPCSRWNWPISRWRLTRLVESHLGGQGETDTWTFETTFILERLKTGLKSNAKLAQLAMTLQCNMVYGCWATDGSWAFAAEERRLCKNGEGPYAHYYQQVDSKICSDATRLGIKQLNVHRVGMGGKIILTIWKAINFQRRFCSQNWRKVMCHL